MATTSSARLTFSVRRAPDNWFEVSWRRADRDVFFQVRDAIKLLPPAVRAYDPVHKVWRVRSLAHLLGLTFYWPGLAERIEELLAKDDEPEPPAPAALPVEVERAFGTLHLLPSAPRALVEASRRVLARQHHPDHGGDTGKMTTINVAADAVLAWLDRTPEPSPSGPARRQRPGAGRRAAA
jgi:hypothetical protein